MGTRPFHRDSHERVFFIYDHRKHGEEADPKDAILFFYPPSVNVNEQIALVGGIIGTVDFCIEVLHHTPALVTLTTCKFALLKTGPFILGLSSELSTPQQYVTQHLNYLWNTFCLFQGSFTAVRQRTGMDGFGLELDRIWNSYFSLCQSFSDQLSQAFCTVPYRDLSQTSGSVFLEASHILQRAQNQPGVIGGVLLNQNRVLCTQLSTEITRRLLLLMPQERHFPCVELKTDFDLPAGIRLLSAYLTPEELYCLGPKRQSAGQRKRDSITDTTSTSPPTPSSPGSEALLFSRQAFPVKQTHSLSAVIESVEVWEGEEGFRDEESSDTDQSESAFHSLDPPARITGERCAAVGEEESQSGVHGEIDRRDTTAPLPDIKAQPDLLKSLPAHDYTTDSDCCGADESGSMQTVVAEIHRAVSHSEGTAVPEGEKEGEDQRNEMTDEWCDDGDVTSHRRRRSTGGGSCAEDGGAEEPSDGEGINSHSNPLITSDQTAGDSLEAASGEQEKGPVSDDSPLNGVTQCSSIDADSESAGVSVLTSSETPLVNGLGEDAAVTDCDGEWRHHSSVSEGDKAERADGPETGQTETDGGPYSPDTDGDVNGAHPHENTGAELHVSEAGDDGSSHFMAASTECGVDIPRQTSTTDHSKVPVCPSSASAEVSVAGDTCEDLPPSPTVGGEGSPAAVSSHSSPGPAGGGGQGEGVDHVSLHHDYVSQQADGGEGEEKESGSQLCDSGRDEAVCGENGGKGSSPTCQLREEEAQEDKIDTCDAGEAVRPSLSENDLDPQQVALEQEENMDDSSVLTADSEKQRLQNESESSAARNSNERGVENGPGVPLDTELHLELLRCSTSSVLTVSDDLMSPNKECLTFGSAEVITSESSGSSGTHVQTASKLQLMRECSTEPSSGDMPHSVDNLSPAHSLSSSTTLLSSPSTSAAPRRAKGRGEGEEDLGLEGREEVLLYVQGHMDTLLVLIMEGASCATRDTINKLWKSSLAKLAELDFAVSDANRMRADDPSNRGSSYLYLKYNSASKALQGTATSPVTSLANELVASSVLLHDTFTTMSTAQDILCRTHTTCCYGYKSMSSETFFQVEATKGGGFPDPRDIAFCLDQFADRKLYADHSTALL